MQAWSYTGEAGALPKTRVWGSKPENVHCFSATAPLGIELRWGCEESSEKTAVGSGVTFKYDPFGRRIEKVSASATSIFVYDGENLVQTVNASGSEVAHYAQGQNIDEPLAMERGSTTDYYETDGLGSISSLTASTGSIAQSYTYDSFGNQTASSGSLTSYFRYTGRDFDTETSLYFYRARYYDESIGRFLGEDPTEIEGGDLNFYRYASNNPSNLADPFGLNPGDKYPGIDCAGWHAVNDVLPQTHHNTVEYGGIIYQNSDGTYSYTAPISGTPTSLPGFWQIPIPTGTSKSGWYHTHPYVPGYDGQHFSPSDQYISNHLNGSDLNPTYGPGYLGTPTNSVRKYVPLVDPTLPSGNHGYAFPMTKNPCGCK
jgi:RHS repeat-associated protein